MRPGLHGSPKGVATAIIQAREGSRPNLTIDVDARRRWPCGLRHRRLGSGRFPLDRRAARVASRLGATADWEAAARETTVPTMNGHSTPTRVPSAAFRWI